MEDAIKGLVLKYRYNENSFMNSYLLKNPVNKKLQFSSCCRTKVYRAIRNVSEGIRDKK